MSARAGTIHRESVFSHAMSHVRRVGRRPSISISASARCSQIDPITEIIINPDDLLRIIYRILFRFARRTRTVEGNTEGEMSFYRLQSGSEEATQSSVNGHRNTLVHFY